MVDCMIYPLLLGLVIGFVIYKVICIEYFDQKFEPSGKPQKYNKEHVLCLLNQFISKLNCEKNANFDVYNIVNVKQVSNRLHVKLFVQHKQKLYVRLYYVQGKIPLKVASAPELTFFSEHGVKTDINNGVSSFTETAYYAKPLKFNYEKSEQSNIDTIELLDSIGTKEAQNIYNMSKV